MEVTSRSDMEFNIAEKFPEKDEIELPKDVKRPDRFQSVRFQMAAENQS